MNTGCAVYIVRDRWNRTYDFASVKYFAMPLINFEFWKLLTLPSKLPPRGLQSSAKHLQGYLKHLPRPSSSEKQPVFYALQLALTGSRLQAYLDSQDHVSNCMEHRIVQEGSPNQIIILPERDPSPTRAVKVATSQESKFVSRAGKA